MYAETAHKLAQAKERLEALADAVRIDEGEVRIKEIDELMSRAGFWDDNEKAQGVIQESKRLRRDLEPLKRLLQRVSDLDELAELAAAENDEAALADIDAESDSALAEIDRLELTMTLSGKHDACGAYVSIHAGAGGTESCDWVAILTRIFTRWAEENDYKMRLVDSLPGEEAGFRSVTLEVTGEYAYGYLKSEIGVHRLVRISPFDAKNRRHTSFASVDVTPEISDDIDIEVKPSDIRVDTYRAGGAGGQHVNKTDSAVRITHLATGIVVQCQNERSQHSNRARALKVLKSRLIQREEAKREQELAQLYSEKGEIAWGNQIRSYVLQPYTLVKDHRTGLEIGDTNSVLDGNLQPFLEAYLRWKRRGDPKKAAGKIS
jgi:peptide chain release factor 2